jgi:hypothetical protein
MYPNNQIINHSLDFNTYFKSNHINKLNPKYNNKNL